jgi:hypothetical protein
MGNDGGSIPGRKDLVKEKEKEKKMENDELVKQSNSKYCALSKEPLKNPVVGDRTGLLYNKESLIRALIEKRLPKTFRHITSLKDVKDLNILITGKEKSDEIKIHCPISMIEYSGLNNFYIIWKCGCVLSKKAIEELNMKDKCIQCGADINLKSDLVSLNYSIKERQEIFDRLMEGKIKNLKNKNSQNSAKDKNMLNNKRTNKDIKGNEYDKKYSSPIRNIGIDNKSGHENANNVKKRRIEEI